MMDIKNKKYVSSYNQLLKACDTLYHNAAMAAGMSDCAFWILYSVYDSDHICTQSEICDHSSLPKQTVNSAMKKLEKDGYLTLQRMEGKMGKYIHLSEAGKDLVQKHIIPVMEAEERACAAFSDEEKEQFLSTFHLFVERLNQEIGSLAREEA